MNQQYQEDLQPFGPSDFPEDLLEDLPTVCNEVVLAKMTDMLSIQDRLNCKFVGDDWKSEAASHERIDYLPTILDEAAELMRSNTQWKFWKKPSPPDITNAKLEFVDMLHFAMSEELAKTGSDETSFNAESVAAEMASGYERAYQTVPGKDGTLPTPTNSPAFNFQKHKSALFRYLASVFLYYESIDGTSCDVWLGGQPEPESVDGDEAFEVLSEMGQTAVGADWSAFWEISLHLGMSFEEIHLTYIAKVSLNELRIANGQKDGRYEKLWWDGLEDNHYLMSLVMSKVASGGAGTFSRSDMTLWLNKSYTAFLAGEDKPTPNDCTTL